MPFPSAIRALITPPTQRRSSLLAPCSHSSLPVPASRSAPFRSFSPPPFFSFPAPAPRSTFPRSSFILPRTIPAFPALIAHHSAFSAPPFSSLFIPAFSPPPRAITPHSAIFSLNQRSSLLTSLPCSPSSPRTALITPLSQYSPLSPRSPRSHHSSLPVLPRSPLSAGSRSLSSHHSPFRALPRSHHSAFPRAPHFRAPRAPLSPRSASFTRSPRSAFSSFFTPLSARSPRSDFPALLVQHSPRSAPFRALRFLIIPPSQRRSSLISPRSTLITPRSPHLSLSILIIPSSPAFPAQRRSTHSSFSAVSSSPRSALITPRAPHFLLTLPDPVRPALHSSLRALPLFSFRFLLILRDPRSPRTPRSPHSELPTLSVLLVQRCSLHNNSLRSARSSLRDPRSLLLTPLSPFLVQRRSTHSPLFSLITPHSPAISAFSRSSFRSSHFTFPAFPAIRVLLVPHSSL